MSLIYIERLMKETRGKLCICPSNWKAMYVRTCVFVSVTDLKLCALCVCVLALCIVFF